MKTETTRWEWLKVNIPDVGARWAIYAPGGVRVAVVDDKHALSAARLMGAAPDLLAACESALELIDNRGNLRFMESAALLKRAIAKATGGAA